MTNGLRSNVHLEGRQASRMGKKGRVIRVRGHVAV
jgi:hypothetical protein